MIEELILHKSTKLQVESALSNNNLHGLGLLGTAGSGKSYLAKNIANNRLRINDFETNPFCMFIDCKIDSGIESIRSIREFLNLKVPSLEEFNRCLILESIENLTHEAQNALLKTIEEPPKGTLIIATCDSLSSLRQTVISRLQWINVLPIDKEILTAAYDKQLEKKKIDQSYAISRGNIADFLRLSDILDDEEDSRYKVIKRAKEIISLKRYDRLIEIENIIKDKELNSKELLVAMNDVLRAVLVSSIKSDKQIDNEKLIKKIDYISIAQQNLNYNLSEKLVLTDLFYKL